MKTHYTAKELAGLPGMPSAKKTVIALAARENWPWRKREGRGGGREYSIEALPAETREALLAQAAAHLPAVVPPAPLPALRAESLPTPATLARWQRDIMDARCAILNHVDTLAEIHGVVKAVKKIVLQAKTGLLPAPLQQLLPTANARSGNKRGKQTLCPRTLFRWRELRAQGVTALAPKEPPKQPIPPWAPYFLKCYRVPRRIGVPEALEDMAEILPSGIPMPSESQCYRLLARMSKVEREMGRRTGNDLRAIKPFRRRDTSDLEPLEVVLCDGHSFKAKVAHPKHGRPFHPEVCAVIDAATRKAIGWSAGLAESAETVADALRHAIQNTGIPAIFYTDPGSGNKAAVNADPAFGRYARLGITFKTGIPGNSQARGLVERFQASCWIRAARKLPTFTGKGMDGTTLHKTSRLLDKEIRAQGQSGMLPSWLQFLDQCAAAIDGYNNRPHKALPKITDSAGKRRHMTPNEAWAVHAAKGWQPMTVTPQELDDLFRPRIQTTTRRGEVRLFGNLYFHVDLQHHQGEQVFVEYEPQDGRFVTVRDLEERLICKAGFEANKSRIYPVSASEKAIEDRARGRRKRKERDLEEIELERRGTTVVITPDNPKVIALRQKLLAEEAAPQAAVVDLPTDAAGRLRYYKDLRFRMGHGERISGRDLEWMGKFEETREGRTLLELEAEWEAAQGKLK